MATPPEVESSALAKQARQIWGGGRFVDNADPASYDTDVVDKIYHDELMPAARRRRAAGSLSPTQILEYASYLEWYLWPFFNAEVPFEHVMSIILMVNEKGREGMDMWAAFQPRSGETAEHAERKFSLLFLRVMMLRTERHLDVRERAAFLTFLVRLYSSLEVDCVRAAALKAMSLPLWLAVSPTRVELELSRYPALRKPWQRCVKEAEALRATAAAAAAASSSSGSGSSNSVAGQKRKRQEDASSGGATAGRGLVLPADPAARAQLQRRLEISFFPSLLTEFFSVLDAIPAAPAAVDLSVVRYCERFLELLLDLLTQLPCRRFLRLLLVDTHFTLRCKHSALARRSPRVASPFTVDAALAGAGGGRAAAAASAGGAAKDALTAIQVSSSGLAGGATITADDDADATSSAASGGAGAGSGSGSASASSRLHVGGARYVAGQEGRLFTQLLDMITFYLDFEVDEQTGKALSSGEVQGKHYSRIAVLQRLAYKHYGGEVREMKEFALGALGLVSQPATLKSFLSVLSDEQLLSLARHLRLLPCPEHAAEAPASSASSAGAAAPAKRAKEEVGGAADGDSGAAAAAALSAAFDAGDEAAAKGAAEAATSVPAPPLSRGFVMDVLLQAHARRISQAAALNLLPLFPNEQLLWDPALVPAGNRYNGEDVLAMPKLNLQFLTLYDYALRAFHLFRLESAYEIRADIVDAVKRAAPRAVTAKDRSGATSTGTRFTGWARMAAPVHSFALKEVAPPKVGAEVPAHVKGEVRTDIASFAPAVRQEWDSLREHDVLFLVTVRCPIPQGVQPDELRDPAQLAKYVARLSGGGAGGAGAAAAAAAAARREDADGSGDGDATMSSAQQPAATSGGAGAGGGRAAQLPDEEDFTFPLRYGIVHVRGCEVVEVVDEAGEVLNEPGTAEASGGKRRGAAGTKRTLRVLLDPAQYHADQLAMARDGSDAIYDSFNLLIRRDSKSNNFKAVLDTIRDVMNGAAQVSAASAIPSWLQDLLLGYGDPAAAHYKSLPAQQTMDVCDMGDTLLSGQHAIAAFPGKRVTFKHEATGAELAPESAAPPYRVHFVAPAGDGQQAEAGAGAEEVVIVPYTPPAPGPYPEDIPKRNGVPFTPTQVEAIRSGMNPGLTLIAGPPGTGKTDTAVQIICNLYHNFPSQRILLVTHSNQALNDLFEKLMARDVAEEHLLRLGAGEKELDTDKDFSKGGRVAAALQRRLADLSEVERLAVSIGVPGDVGYTCETAEHFNLYHVISRVEAFRLRFGVPAPPEERGLEAALADIAATNASAGKASSAQSVYAAASEKIAAARLAYHATLKDKLSAVPPAAVAEAFPFPGFFATAPGGLPAIFKGADAAADWLAAEACFRHLSKLFSQLASYRAFELLRSHRSRQDYMLTKQARIIAMTCTHAAIQRGRLLQLGFKYDTLVMEEAAQILEVETFIPMVLQSADASEGGVPRLKRVILLGDHNQLPPVVQNMAFQKYARLEQSMFARLVRLGVPYVQLDMQGRARPGIAALYNWRYKALADLPSTYTAPEYVRANAGFAFDYQLIDVPDFQGKGETTPLPHFYQNLGEAEYAVAVYQYLRLTGVAAGRIALLTTYNGQKALLRDIIRKRCAAYPVFGEPAAVETVDKFQGQQADFILLSLVRTRTVGHLRDVRRLVVALSRARLGLYVFARQSIFAGCYELAPAFTQLAQRPNKLHLLIGEQHPTPRALGAPIAAAVEASGGVLAPVTVDGVLHMGRIVEQILKAQMAVAASARSAAAAAAASAALAASPPAPPTGGAGGGAGGGGVAADEDRPAPEDREVEEEEDGDE